MTRVKATILLVALLSLTMACAKKSEPTSAPADDSTKQTQNSGASSAQAGNSSADLKPPDTSAAPVAVAPAPAPASAGTAATTSEARSDTSGDCHYSASLVRPGIEDQPNR